MVRSALDSGAQQSRAVGVIGRHHTHALCEHKLHQQASGDAQGKFEHKKNTFTDFIAVAEHLIASRMTSPERLCIEVRLAMAHRSIWPLVTHITCPHACISTCKRCASSKFTVALLGRSLHGLTRLFCRL